MLQSENHDVDHQDLHGNTPLMLAAMLGRTQCIELLLRHEATISIRNHYGWGPLNEVVSFGSREPIAILWKEFKKRSLQNLEMKIPTLLDRIADIPDFTLTIKWKFSSWLPFVGRFCPSDDYTIHKKGTYLRIDTTLVDFRGLTWIRGNLSFIVKGIRASRQNRRKTRTLMRVLDHDTKEFWMVKDTKSEGELQELDLNIAVDGFLSSPITTLTTPGKAEFTRALQGIYGFRTEKTERVGPWEARTFNVRGIDICIKKRSEHLTEEERKTLHARSSLLQNGAKLEERLKADVTAEERRAEKFRKAVRRKRRKERRRREALVLAMRERREMDKRIELHPMAQLGEPQPVIPNLRETLLDDDENDDDDEEDDDDDDDDEDEGDGDEGDDEGDERDFFKNYTPRPGLPAPPEPVIDFEDYASTDPTNTSYHLGRPMVLKEDKKHFAGTVCMTDDYPLSLETVLSVLELAPKHKHIEKLKDFLSTRLPPGFPVKLNMPVFPTIAAEVVFTSFDATPIDDSLFEIPSDYMEGEGKEAPGGQGTSSRHRRPRHRDTTGRRRGQNKNTLEQRDPTSISGLQDTPSLPDPPCLDPASSNHLAEPVLPPPPIEGEAAEEGDGGVLRVQEGVDEQSIGKNTSKSRKKRHSNKRKGRRKSRK